MRPSRFLVVMFLSLVAMLAEATGAARAQSVKVLTNFSGQSASLPYGPLVQGRNGTLYGTTSGIPFAAGAVFQLSLTGGLAFPHTFDDTDGSQPAGLVLSTDGNFYGVAVYGGSSESGVLFRLSPSGTYTVLHEFAGGADGAYPAASPIQATDGSLYGVTEGNFNVASTLYKYTPQSGSFETLYTFDAAHGQYAYDLIQATDGNLYGAAVWGGNSSCGTAFKFTISGVPLWAYSFPCGAGGSNPGILLQATDGNFYGTTGGGGLGVGYGTIFTSNSEGTVSILYSLPPVQAHGASPVTLVQGTDGNLYGTTDVGGQSNDGVLFKLTTSGTFALLYSFDGTSGSNPDALMQHTDGLLYGTAEEGGASNAGTVYSFNARLSPFVAFVVPAGRYGQAAEILGQGLLGTTSVTFNGKTATSFNVVNDTYMTAVVPSGATTGKVVVTTPSGALTSNVNFRIIQ